MIPEKDTHYLEKALQIHLSEVLSHCFGKLLEEPEFQALDMYVEFRDAVRQHEDEMRTEAERPHTTIVPHTMSMPLEIDDAFVHFRCHFETDTAFALQQYNIVTHCMLRMLVTLTGTLAPVACDGATVTIILPNLKSVTYQVRRITMVVSERDDQW